jgi:hypothetical protein
MAARYLDMHGSEAWNAMRTAWRKFVDGVRDDLAAQDRRGVVRTHERTAWQQIVTVDQTADEDMIILTLLAMGIMFEQEPAAFQDHPSFMAQTARRFRALSQDLKKSYRYSTVDSAKVLTDISRMAVLTMGKRLAEGYALYGYHIARGWAEKAEEEARIRKAAISVCTGSPRDGSAGEPQQRTMETTA